MSADPAIERLMALLRIPTVSRNDPADEDRAAFAAFRDKLAELYPLIHAQLELDLVETEGGAVSLLYRWPGSGTGRPSVLLAHHDVVPADEPGWAHPPFEAVIVPGADRDGDRVRGRGAIDDKGALAALLEAVEARLAAGYRPSADVYLFSGANEETTSSGAAAAVALLTGRGIRPGLVLDEGGAVAEGAIPGVVGPVAFVGVGEKGIAGVE
ncbi:MAG: M20/M25/M40 family metallo-hydrolase, partial [Leifsonia sp.]